MNKKIIKYLIWTIIIAAVLILMPTKQTMANLNDVLKDGSGDITFSEYKKHPNLFCLNQGKVYFNKETFKIVPFNKNLINNKTINENVLRYIISEIPEGATKSENGYNYKYQIAIWYLTSGEWIDEYQAACNEAKQLVANAYAYNNFVANPNNYNVTPYAERIEGTSNQFVVYYTKYTNTSVTDYTGVYQNLVSVTATNEAGNSVALTKGETIHVSGNTYKTIYTNSGADYKLNIKITYEKGQRTANLYWLDSSERQILNFYEETTEGKSRFKLVEDEEGVAYYRCSNTRCRQRETELVTRYSFESDDFKETVEASVESKCGNYYYFFGYVICTKCNTAFISCTGKGNTWKWIYVKNIKSINSATNTFNEMSWLVRKENNDGTGKKEPEDPQNLLYGKGEKTIGTKTQTIELISPINLTINKTDSLQKDSQGNSLKLSNVQFKIELTNVKSIEGYLGTPSMIITTTDTSGQIKLTGILPNNEAEAIIVTITEVAEPTAIGYYYKPISPVTLTIRYANGKWETSQGEPSGNTITVEIQNTPYIDYLSGNVWQDGQTGEKGNVSDANGQKDPSEINLQGVIVELYSVKDSKVIRNTVTDTNGNYSFTDIPKTNEGYKIIFKYNGIDYVETPTGTISKPAEVNRTAFNNRFKTISASKSNDNTTLAYTYNSANKTSTLNTTIAGHTTGATDAKFQMSAQTGVYTTKANDVSCGLVKKNFDLAIGTDVKNAKLEVNGKTTTYNYAQIMNGELNANFQNSSSTADVIYNLYLYSSDYNYRIKDYKTDIGGNNVPDSDNNGIADYEDIKNLEAYVTYSVILKNQTTHNATVNEFVYYYDEAYKPYNIVSTDKYDVSIDENARKITFTSKGDGFKLTSPDYRVEVDLTFKIEDKNGILRVDETATNVVEITRYSTDEGGLIDKDSAPANGITNGKITQYEDDTDEAKGLNIVLRKKETRRIEGTVFDDKDKDGIKNNNDTVVNDVIVQLIEIKKIGGKYYEYIWQETKSGSNTVKRLSEDGNAIDEITYRETAPNDGSYVFTDFIPGNYIIRFIYGDGKTYDVTDNVKKYNGQDYKSTKDLNYNKPWYNTAGYSVGESIARDNEARRLEVMAYSTTINTENGQDLADKTDVALDATWMCAETSKINIPVDDVENAKTNTAENKTDTTTTSYQYTANGDIVLFGNMNFGLTLRPETNIVLEKHITSLKITPSGTGVLPIVDAKALDIEKIVNGTEVEVQGVTTGLATIKSTAQNRGFWQVATDVEELMQGADLEVEYTYVIRNDSEEDYLTAFLIEAYEKGIDDGSYVTLLKEKATEVKQGTKGQTQNYGAFLGEFYYTGDAESARNNNELKLVSSRVDTFEESLNNDLIFNNSQTASFKVAEQQVKKNVYGVNSAEGTKEIEINTVVQNTTVSTFLTPRLEEKHTTTTADWSRTMTLTTTLATVSGGELGANLPSHIAEIVQYSNAAGRKDMTATPGNLNYVHSDDSDMTLDAYVKKGENGKIVDIKYEPTEGYEKINEQDEFWAESIIITKPTGENKQIAIQIAIITISAIAVIGVGIVLIKKFVLSK